MISLNRRRFATRRERVSLFLGDWYAQAAKPDFLFLFDTLRVQPKLFLVSTPSNGASSRGVAQLR